MKIKLKEGSSVEIVNQAGDTIAKINEDGTIEGFSGGGTKLYRHNLIAEGVGYDFIVITTNPQPIDFSINDTYSKLHDFLISQNALLFVELNNSNEEIFYDRVREAFYAIMVEQINNKLTCTASYYDDWPLSDTTDTVTPL